MRITAKSSIPALAVGVLDTSVEQAMAGRTVAGVPVDVLVSGGLTFGSLAVNLSGRETEVSEKVFYASLPLFLKRVIPMIIGRFGGASPSSAPAYRPASAPAPTRPASKSQTQVSVGKYVAK